MAATLLATLTGCDDNPTVSRSDAGAMDARPDAPGDAGTPPDTDGSPFDAAAMDSGAPPDPDSGVQPDSGSCAPLSCADRGVACGPSDDGCGLPLDCGPCGPGESCADGACTTMCVPRCEGRQCGVDGCGGMCGSCDPGQTCGGGLCRCDPPVEVVFYTQSAWNVLGDALAADPSACGHYYISIPAVDDGTGVKTMPRAGEAARMHARGPRMHALAEFHWTSWARVTGMSWYEKGVEFRRRMALAGYDVAANDGWAVNELPSPVRYDASTRMNVREALRGLYEGPPGAVPVKGAVFIIGMGHQTVSLATYKNNLRGWLTDAAFWSSVNRHAAWWAQEVYTDPRYVCVDGTTVAERSGRINAYVEHVARHASVGPAGANIAQSYLGRAYTPLMNAVFRAPPTSGYGDTRLTIDQMKHHVSTQVYAARAWASSHAYPDGRLGFAWARQPGVVDAELAEVAARLAASIHHAYDAGAAASRACSPSGAFTWCACRVSGASFNDAWDTFAVW